MIALGALAAAVALTVTNGTNLSVWYVRSDAARTHITFRTEYSNETPGHSRHMDDEETDLPISALGTTFAGLTADELFGSGAHVRFENRRDAGVIAGEGWAAGGNASGNFTIALNPAYGQELQRRGIGAPDSDQQTILVLEDGSYATLDALNQYGYDRPNVDQFVRLLEHGVSIAYLRDMHAAGFAPREVETIIRARDHGVDAAFVSGLRAHNVTGTLDDYIRARDHGVSADQVSGLARLGYTGLSLSDLVRMRDHGVDVAFVERLHSQGYTKLSVDDLVKLRDHGI